MRELSREKVRNTVLKILKISINVALLLVVLAIYKNCMDYNLYKNYIEPYCSVQYKENVEQYKSCKQQKVTTILSDLTKQQKEIKKYDITNLPEIKF